MLVNGQLTVHSVGVDCRYRFETTFQLEPYAPYGVYKRYLWKDADFQGIAHYLSDVDWQYCFSMHLTVESIWSAFWQVLYEAVELYVPYITTNMAGTKSSRLLQKVPQNYS